MPAGGEDCGGRFSERLFLKAAAFSLASLREIPGYGPKAFVLYLPSRTNLTFHSLAPY
jgi:hypothetical protein